MVVIFVASSSGNLCTPATTLNRNEQMVCNPDQYSRKWTAEYSSTGGGYAHVYKVKKSSLPTTHRYYTWKDYSVSLYGSYDDFSMSAPLGLTGTLDISCSGIDCKSVKVYLLNDKQFYNALDSDGYFREYAYSPGIDGIAGSRTWTFSDVGPDYFHLIVSGGYRYDADITYSVYLDYTVYDISSATAESCISHKCTYEDGIEADEMLIVDFPTIKTESYAGKDRSEPEYFSASIHDHSLATGAIVCGVVVGVLAVLILASMVLCCVRRAIKKAKKQSSSVSGIAEMGNVVVATTTPDVKVAQPGSDVTPGYVAGQPTPAGYAVGEPAPAYAAGEPAPAYAAGQPGPYPGEAYPAAQVNANPYPDGMPPATATAPTTPA